MKIEMSNHLVTHKPIVQKLVKQLSKSYKYVSVLGTDVLGKNYLVERDCTHIKDCMFKERGFVLRVYNGVNYWEYSFNILTEDNFKEVLDYVHTNCTCDYPEDKMNKYPVIDEDEIIESFSSELENNPLELSDKEVLDKLNEVAKLTLECSEKILNVRCSFEYIKTSKIFISTKKDLEQSYISSLSNLLVIASDGNSHKYTYQGFSGKKGSEVIDELKTVYKNVADECLDLLDSKTVNPGTYDVICDPGVSGLIAHEAFGHGVEMDMFLKDRAKGKEYIGKKVASNITNMRDGAKSFNHMASYSFDDEGVLGHDTHIITNGVLNSGISDLISAMKLKTKPTGNGRRESFERKAYSRMTNTFFDYGNDNLDDMISSIKDGYLLTKAMGGMEDPKSWGIQCTALMGKEIKNGKLTGKIVSPLILTGYVPELLDSISMVSKDLHLEGSGYCGKGHKEFVKVSCGGPYIKAKVRLG